MRRVLGLLLPLLLSSLTPSAKADDTFNHPGDHPKYSVEVEPHVIFGWGRGLGLGARFNFPIMDNGFIKSINNNLAIGVGAELIWLQRSYYWGWARYYYQDGAAFLSVPVDLQWNLFIAQHWSLFGELGVALFHGFYSCGALDCSAIGFDPVGAIGARYHFNEHVALTFRLGYPGFTAGGSFW